MEPFLKLYFAKKNCLIKKENETETELYFITSGTVRLFFEKEANDINVNIAFPISFTSSYTSFLTQKPSTFNFQALTNIESIKINKKDLETIYNVTSSGKN
ncbi:MAG: Crp/Fnr family transcriptional regulator [Bacteroidetes bacterium]|nr:Crp/Fnr family transcriptional regulator [Bacteroidota bacterium]